MTSLEEYHDDMEDLYTFTEDELREALDGLDMETGVENIVQIIIDRLREMTERLAIVEILEEDEAVELYRDHFEALFHNS